MGKTIRRNSKYNHEAEYTERNKKSKNKKTIKIFFEKQQISPEPKKEDIRKR